MSHLPAYKADLIARERARTERAFNEPPYTLSQSPYFRVEFRRTRNLADGSHWDQFDVMQADADHLNAAWNKYEHRKDGVTQPVSFYVRVPHTDYTSAVWMPFPTNVACLVELGAIAAVAGVCVVWGVWGLVT